MSERLTLPVNQTETSPHEEMVTELRASTSRLAREGLEKIVKTGQVTREHAIEQHALFFPKKSNQ